MAHMICTPTKGDGNDQSIWKQRLVLTMDLMVRMECNQLDINGTHVYIKLVD